jgi:WD40 repeat protein
VFRDDASLSANPGLWSSIQAALDASRFFVLLASPQAAESKWVGREVAYWLEHEQKHEDPLVVLTEGDIAWDEARADFDWERTTALPKELAGAFSEEPRYIDLRWARSKEHLSLRDTRFREAVADVAATLHGRPKDELVGEDVRQHRRALRLARGAGAALLLLAAAASVAAVLAVQQRNTAREQRDRAEQQARIATSRSLAAAALQNVDRKLDLAALLALESLRLDRSAETRNAVATVTGRGDRIVRTLHDDPDGVDGLAAVSDGRGVVTTSLSGRVTLWDARRGRIEQLVRRGDGDTIVSAVSVRGLVAFPRESGGIVLRDLHTGRDLARLPLGDLAPIDLSFDRSGARLAAVDETGAIVVWDVGRHRVAARLEAGLADLDLSFEPEAAGLAFSPDGRTLAFGASDGALTTWDLTAGRPVRTRLGRQNGAIHDLAFAPGGRLLAVAGANGTIRLWDYRRGRPVTIPIHAHAGGANGVAFSPDGRTLASVGVDRTLRLWRLPGTAPIGAPLRAHSESVTGVAFLDDDTVVTAGEEGVAEVWSVSQPVSAQPLVGVGRPVDRVAFSPDGRLLVTGGYGDVRFWDARTGEAVSRWLRGHAGETVTGLAFDSTGSLLASSGDDGAVRFWEVAARRPLTRALKPNGDDPAGYAENNPIVFVPGSRLASVASEDHLTLWDPHSRATQNVDLGAISEPASVAISRHGLLAVGSQGGDIVLRSSRGKRLGALRAGGLHGFASIWALAFSPDGRLLVSGDSDGLVRFWDVARRRQAGEPLRLHRGAVRSLAFSPDGRTLASGAGDGTMRLWDVGGRRALGEPLLGGRTAVTSVAFSPDGRTLAAAGPPGGRVTLFDRGLWPLTADQAAARLCALAGRNLTASEWAEFAAAVRPEPIC